MIVVSDTSPLGSLALINHLWLLHKKHQSVTTWANQDKAFQEIAEDIRLVAMEIRKNSNISDDTDEP